MQRSHWLLLGLLAAAAVGIPLALTSGLFDEDPFDGGVPDDPETSAGLIGRGAPGQLPQELRGLGIPDELDVGDRNAVLELVLESLEQDPVNWARVAQLVGQLEPPIEDPLRGRLLAEVRAGNPSVRRVFELVRDPTFADDLLAMLKGRDFEPGAREVLLQALARLPGADADAIVSALEVFLVGDTTQDQDVLRAIVKRGSPASARAILAYTLRSLNPMPLRVVLGQAVKHADAEGRAEIRAALGQPHERHVMVTLIDCIGALGEDDLVRPLLALDREGSHPRVRRAVYGALSRIGTDGAVERLIEAGAAQDDRGGDARRALERMSAADDAARKRMMDAYEEIDDPVRRIGILRALTEMEHEPVIPLLAEALDSEDPRLRRAGVHGLRTFGERARPHVGKMFALWGAADKGTRAAIVGTLASAGGSEARRALASLQDAPELTDRIRSLVAQALRSFDDDSGN